MCVCVYTYTYEWVQREITNCPSKPAIRGTPFRRAPMSSPPNFCVFGEFEFRSRYNRADTMCINYGVGIKMKTSF